MLVLNALGVLLKRAVEWDVIERMPCTITLPVVLLGGDAGLRCGEILGLVAGTKC